MRKIEKIEFVIDTKDTVEVRKAVSLVMATYMPPYERIRLKETENGYILRKYYVGRRDYDEADLI